MTELLAQAVEKVSKLPAELQDELARQILEDLVGESRWDQTLARSQDQLEELADQALAEMRRVHRVLLRLASCWLQRSRSV